MKINAFMLAMQVMEAVTAVSNLEPGDEDELPTIHISDKGKHIDIAITISRDAVKASK